MEQLEYEFSLEVEGLGEDADNAIYDAGHNDVLVCWTNGALHVDFNKSASSYGEAVRIAIEQMEALGGVVVDIERIPTVQVSDDNVIDYCIDHADLYVESVVNAGRMMLDRVRAGLSMTQPEVEIIATEYAGGVMEAMGEALGAAAEVAGAAAEAVGETVGAAAEAVGEAVGAVFDAVTPD